MISSTRTVKKLKSIQLLTRFQVATALYTISTIHIVSSSYRKIPSFWCIPTAGLLRIQLHWISSSKNFEVFLCIAKFAELWLNWSNWFQLLMHQLFTTKAHRELRLEAGLEASSSRLQPWIPYWRRIFLFLVHWQSR